MLLSRKILLGEEKLCIFIALTLSGKKIFLTQQDCCVTCQKLMKVDFETIYVFFTF